MSKLSKELIEEHLPRFWDTEQNEMLYPLVKHQSVCYKITGQTCEVDLGRMYLNTRFIPMKPTGISDIHNKLCYENDIIVAKKYPFYGDAPDLTYPNRKCKELNYVGVVGVDYRGAFYETTIVSNRVCGGFCGGELDDVDKLEIIGNSYENAELLKIKEEA